MNKALMLTAFNRPHYLSQTLQSWEQVRGFYDWPLHIFLEPSPVQDQMVEIILSSRHPDINIHRNPQVYGVLHNPWVGFETLFEDYDFVVSIEDDLIVSEDVLEYLESMAEIYKDDPSIYTILSYTNEEGDPQGYRKVQVFKSWAWGTWKSKWKKILGPTWDHDYSTFNRAPGLESGWDWNLHTRIYPQLDLWSIVPTQSRVQNIGVHGVHGTQENFQQSPSFRADRAPGEFHYTEGI